MDFPRGIVSADRTSALLTDATGRLQLVNLSTGELVATSAGPATPLSIHDGRVVASRLEAPSSLVVFSAVPEGGTFRELWRTALRIPEWALRTAEPGESGRDEAALSVKGRVEDGDLVVVWTARSFYRGGAAPPMEVARRAQQRVGGEARIALSDGRLASEAPTEPDADTARQPPAPPAVPEGRKLLAYRDGAIWATHAWPTPRGDAFLTRAADGRGAALQQRRPGAQDEVHELLSAPSVEASVADEGRLVFARASDGDWQVFLAETAERVAEIPYDEHTVEIATVGESVFALVEEAADGARRTELRCRSLADGHLVWSRALGEERVPSAPPPLPR